MPRASLFIDPSLTNCVAGRLMDVEVNPQGVAFFFLSEPATAAGLRTPSAIDATMRCWPLRAAAAGCVIGETIRPRPPPLRQLPVGPQLKIGGVNAKVVVVGKIRVGDSVSKMP